MMVHPKQYIKCIIITEMEENIFIHFLIFVLDQRLIYNVRE